MFFSDNIKTCYSQSDTGEAQKNNPSCKTRSITGNYRIIASYIYFPNSINDLSARLILVQPSKASRPMISAVYFSFINYDILRHVCRCSIQIIRRCLIYVIVHPVRIQVIRMGAPCKHRLIIRVVIRIIVLGNLRIHSPRCIPLIF